MFVKMEMDGRKKVEIWRPAATGPYRSPPPLQHRGVSPTCRLTCLHVCTRVARVCVHVVCVVCVLFHIIIGLFHYTRRPGDALLHYYIIIFVRRRVSLHRPSSARSPTYIRAPLAQRGILCALCTSDSLHRRHHKWRRRGRPTTTDDDWRRRRCATLTRGRVSVHTVHSTLVHTRALTHNRVRTLSLTRPTRCHCVAKAVCTRHSLFHNILYDIITIDYRPHDDVPHTFSAILFVVNY